MDVSVKYIRWLQKEVGKINRCGLYDLRIWEGNKRVGLSKKLLDSFAMTGLNNMDFITSNYYKKEVK